ncbi:MAG: hypothetical protein NDJ90_01840 [Oligoflexia bacterium]|nr:hypothetical protein [Oligoflexia bacterium]
MEMEMIGHPRSPSSFTLVAMVLLALLMACATSPRFVPSRDIESVPSLEEGLLLCNEYRAPAPAERPNALEPYVECVEHLAQRFPEPALGAFPVFHRELKLQYGLLRDAYWNAALGAELELAIHALLRALWSGKAPPADRAAPSGFTGQEKTATLRHFPQTARALRAEDWPLARDPLLDPRLESVKAALASLSEESGADEDRTAQAGPAGLEERSRLCARLQDLRRELAYLDRLWRDQTELVKAEQGSERERTLPVVKDRYARKLDALSRELENFRSEIHAARAREGFRLKNCLKGAS